ncbi:MAG: phenylalanine--tRNA ligase subunit beta [Bacteroidetes bacterium]|nr:MAG: phenylalanine--tRNA ligase subunit beta [Bacteroidota bacterium]
MRISLNWLRRYLDVTDTPERIAEVLTSVGLEVESMERLGEALRGFVVGHVLETSKHPNADRLSVCSVRLRPDGEPVQIVCGAPNVAAGQKVPVGLPGAVVPSSLHDPSGKPFTLAVAKIRGVESNGMICSESELGIGQDKSGIMVLPEATTVGMPLAEFFGRDDVVMELGVTPNRPDCLSHLGVARDLSAYYRIPVRRPEVAGTDGGGNTAASLTSVTVKNPAACPRYTARVIQDVTVKESPEWLKRLLTAAGLRPINNIVDVTNFVMFEYGQPLHAFDMDRLSGRRIVVRSAEAGESFTTLDGRTHAMTGNELMICDAERSVALAGVMGGLNSEITPETVTVLLESAYFDPVTVRRTAKRLGISTDASYRFERGVDPNAVDEASRRAAQLIAELSGGSVVPGVVDEYPSPIAPKEITLRLARVNAMLGTELTMETVSGILTSLGHRVTHVDAGTVICASPTFRPDIEQEIDLIEEVARMYGYNNIADSTSGSVVFTEPSAAERRLSDVTGWLQANGFNESVTNSLMDAKTATLFSSSAVSVRNPLSAELETLRPALLPSLLQAVAYNHNRGARTVKFFETGSVFERVSGDAPYTFVPGYVERFRLGMVLSGFSGDLSWHEKQREFDIYDVKGTVLSLLRSIGIDNIHLIYYDASNSLNEQSIGIEIQGTYVGLMGRCSEELTGRFKIEKPVYFAEFDLGPVLSGTGPKKFKGFSKYPSVTRDVAFVVGEEVAAGDVERTIAEAGGAIVSGVTPFDLFTGKNLGTGKKSLAFSVQVTPSDRTLTEAEIDAVVAAIVSRVSSRHGAVLRQI